MTSALFCTTHFYLYASPSDWEALFNNRTRYRRLRSTALYSIIGCNRRLRAYTYCVVYESGVDRYSINFIDGVKRCLTGGYCNLTLGMRDKIVSHLLNEGYEVNHD